MNVLSNSGNGTEQTKQNTRRDLTYLVVSLAPVQGGGCVSPVSIIAGIEIKGRHGKQILSEIENSIMKNDLSSVH